MLENVQVLYHSSIRFNGDKVIYFDPFNIKENYKDADLIFITHDHYDHYSVDDINKVLKEGTIIIAPNSMLNVLLKNGYKEENIISVIPCKQYEIEEIKIETIPAYNMNKKFHPKENDWVGYVIELNGIRYYIAGDTDITMENKQVKCDVTFVPVGGTYTMNAKEAAQLVNEIKPKIAVPIHYGNVVGTKQDAIDFINLLHPDIQGKILLD